MKNSIVMLALLLQCWSCGQRTADSPGSISAAPAVESASAEAGTDTTVDPSKTSPAANGSNANASASDPSAANPSASMKAILDSNIIRMSRIELTNHPVKDFALLMRVHHAGARQLISSAMKNKLDPQLAKIAQDVENGLKQEVVDLNRFIIDARFQKQQKESPVSSSLMRAMTPNNESQMPLSGNVSDDFAMLLITSLQSANDMVKMMDDGGAAYEVSGFSEPMVARNQKHIEALKQWRQRE